MHIKKVGILIEEGKFAADTSRLEHTHEGSIGNLCNTEIKAMMEQTMAGFHFEKAVKAIQMLLEN